MKAPTVSVLLGAALLAALPATAAPARDKTRDVDTRFPTLAQKFQLETGSTPLSIATARVLFVLLSHLRLHLVSLVDSSWKSENNCIFVLARKNITNSINVISLAYIPNGMTVHYQTPFGLDGAPTVHYGQQPSNLSTKATGYTTTYDRTPPCSIAMATMCSQYFHNVLLENLKPGATYYYSIPASNGTSASKTLNFATARAPGNTEEFSIAILNDMGYTNAQGTYKYLNEAADNGIAFAWHGGDISYADDWFDGILACQEGEVCYNGSASALYNTPPAPFPASVYNNMPNTVLPNIEGPQYARNIVSIQYVMPCIVLLAIY